MQETKKGSSASDRYAAVRREMIADWIARELRATGLTTSELAVGSGLSDVQLGKFMRGEATPAVCVLNRMEATFVKASAPQAAVA